MEPVFLNLLSAKEKVRTVLEQEERSMNWLSKKTGIPFSTIHHYFGKTGKAKIPPPDYILEKIREIFPQYDLSAPPELLPHERLEAEKQAVKQLFKDKKQK